MSSSNNSGSSGRHMRREDSGSSGSSMRSNSYIASIRSVFNTSRSINSGSSSSSRITMATRGETSDTVQQGLGEDVLRAALLEWRDIVRHWLAKPPPKWQAGCDSTESAEAAQRLQRPSPTTDASTRPTSQCRRQDSTTEHAHDEPHSCNGIREFNSNGGSAAAAGGVGVGDGDGVGDGGGVASAAYALRETSGSVAAAMEGRGSAEVLVPHTLALMRAAISVAKQLGMEHVQPHDVFKWLDMYSCFVDVAPVVEDLMDELDAHTEPVGISSSSSNRSSSNSSSSMSTLQQQRQSEHQELLFCWRELKQRLVVGTMTAFLSLKQQLRRTLSTFQSQDMQPQQPVPGPAGLALAAVVTKLEPLPLTKQTVDHIVQCCVWEKPRLSGFANLPTQRTTGAFRPLPLIVPCSSDSLGSLLEDTPATPSSPFPQPLAEPPSLSCSSGKLVLPEDEDGPAVYEPAGPCEAVTGVAFGSLLDRILEEHFEQLQAAEEERDKGEVEEEEKQGKEAKVGGERGTRVLEASPEGQGVIERVMRRAGRRSLRVVLHEEVESLQAEVGKAVELLWEIVEWHASHLLPQHPNRTVQQSLFRLNNAALIDMLARAVRLPSHLRNLMAECGEAFIVACTSKLMGALGPVEEYPSLDGKVLSARLGAFNSEVELFLIEQLTYQIPHVACRRWVKVECEERIIAAYSRFLAPHRDIIASTPNYMYSPSMLRRLLKKSFTKCSRP